jgi:hypothetical protein
MSRPYDDDLLAPELTDADDAIGFDRPWNPWSLVTLTFFCGLPAGGGLLALNFDRLGMPGRRLPTLAVVVALTTLVVLGRVWAMGSGLIPTDQSGRQIGRWATQAIFVLAAMAIAAPQQKRFRIFQASGEPAGHLLWPAVTASAISLGYQSLIGLIGYQFFIRR